MATIMAIIMVTAMGMGVTKKDTTMIVTVVEEDMVNVVDVKTGLSN
ncbi:hypothetical protein [Oceanobacillus iheyensis]|nr:hypothetical protein [Oceanobacillus iheyensis]